MKQKIFFTSIISMLVVMPAMAEPSHTDEFPSTGLMQEDYKYTNAATFENTGVYDGSVDAIAEFEYQIGAGEYLPADSETVITCPAGSYCPGIDGNVQYNQSSAQGIQTCPAGFDSSADGASSDTQCFRACDINNVGDSVTAIAHATAISGNDYYGSGVDTCEPTECENGWHVKAAVPDVQTAIGTGAGAYEAFVRNNGTFGEKNSSNEKSNNGISYYGLSTDDHNSFAIDYGNNGMLYGHGICSTQQGYRDTVNNNDNSYNNPTTFTSLTDETGQEGAFYCYIRIDGYKPNGQNRQSLASKWVFISNLGGNNADYCAFYCAEDGPSSLRRTNSGDLALRAALLGSVQSSPAMCEANTITINWNGTTQEAINANNAGTATYGSDVRTPVKAQTIKGKTFKGWRFSKPETTNLPE